MAYYLFEIKNHLLPDASDKRVRFDVEEGVDPMKLWPHLFDPVWGIVDEVWESHESRVINAKNAELLVRAGDDLPCWLSPYGQIVSYNRPGGRIFIDSRGRLHHVTDHKKTELEGDWAHDLFACGFGQVEDLEEFLTEQAIRYVEDCVEPVLRHLGLEPEPAEILEGVLESLSNLELPKVNYEDLDECVDTTLHILNSSHSMGVFQ